VNGEVKSEPTQLQIDVDSRDRPPFHFWPIFSVVTLNRDGKGERFRFSQGRAKPEGSPNPTRTDAASSSSAAAPPGTFGS
jgi:hypothetical protein